MSDVIYRLVGGPLDGETTQAPPIKFHAWAAEYADAQGVELGHKLTLTILGHPEGWYVFSDSEVDVLVWREHATQTL